MSLSSIRLTQTVQKGGCAAKVAAHELRSILSQVRFPPVGSEVLIDGRLFDDAAVVKVSDDLALVQTLDFFTPIVDEPHLFGQVAAANALSDVYAMGGLPKTALAILAFPLAEFSHDLVQAILQGACDVLKEAKASLVGGHSIDDATLKFGLSVTGEVHPDKIWSNQGARVGDRLILTKALGTGTLCAGIKRDVWQTADVQDALDSMAQLNDIPARLGSDELSAVHAATDITGFGLTGHAMHIARASRVSLRIESAKLPVFEKSLISLERELLTKAHRTNREYTDADVMFPENKVLAQLVVDPQTSGGLLLSVSPEKAQGILQKIKSSFRFAHDIGEVLSPSEKSIQFV